MDIVYATGTSVVALDGGGQVQVLKGTHWPADDPIVVAHRDMFSSDPRFGLSFTSRPAAFDAPVEQATAVPGEKRSVRRG
jgi:hypothetical protein